MNRSNGNNSGAEIPTIPDRTSAIAELTVCLSQAYIARAYFHLDLGETDLALADLDATVRLDPDNIEANRLGSLIAGHPGQVVPSPTVDGQTQGNEPAIDAGVQPQTRFEAGYQVMARYPDNPGRGDEPLGPAHPLTALGRLQAIEFARHMCSDESSRERGLLYDAYLTGGEQFDTVVTEFRSLVREIHLEKAADDDGKPVID
jgi:hypothetical protein